MDVMEEVLDKGSWFCFPQSSNIARFRYMRESGVLVIQFKNGNHYRYDSAPVELVKDFVNSPSKGKFFFARIKNIFKGTKCDEGGNPVIPGGSNGGDIGTL